MSHAFTTSPTPIYSIPADFAVVRGDKIRFSEAVYLPAEGGRFLGMRIIEARIVADGSRAGRRAGTMTLQVLASEGVSPISPGQQIARDPGTVFRHGALRARWRNEQDRKPSRRAGNRRTPNGWRHLLALFDAGDDMAMA